MRLPPVANVAQIELRWIQMGENTENVLHVSSPGPFSQDNLVQLGNLFIVWVGSFLTNLLPGSTRLQEVHVRDLSTADGMFYAQQPSQDMHGNSGAGAPNNVTLAVKKLTARSGRSGRGRLFVPGIPLQNIEPNSSRVGISYIQAMDGAMSALTTALDVAGEKLVLVSYFHLKAVRAVPLVEEIVTFAVNPVLDSQRCRLPEHKRRRKSLSGGGIVPGPAPGP